MRVPQTPDTRGGAPTMPDAALRYFSMCTNEFASQRFYACATDDQTTVGADGFAEFVVSTKAARPAWATADCGYTWLPFGSATGERPDPTPHAAAGRFHPGDPAGRGRPRRAATMGDYFPATRYLQGWVRRPPCRATRQSSGPSLGLPPSTKKGSLHQSAELHHPSEPAAAVRTVTRGRAQGRDARGQALRAKVNLKGLPRGTYRVRDRRPRPPGRKRVTTVRTYRTCVKSASKKTKASSRSAS